MSGPLAEGRPPALLRLTIRRSTVLGRFFLVYGTALSAVLGVVLAVTSGPSFASGYSVVLPVFGAVGSMGGLSVFTSDRVKGALEYFLAYGLSPRRLFGNVLIATIVLVTVVIGIGMGAGVGLYLARGNPPSGTLVLGVGLYAVPMAYASAAFATIVGMYWSALSSPRTGMNSPIGLAPLIGVLPSVIVIVTIAILEAAGRIASGGAIEVGVLGMAAVTIVTVVLLALSGRLLRSERLLSPT